MSHRRVWTLDVDPAWDGPRQVLGDILEPADDVPEEYFVPADQLPRWEYLKGAKREQRYHKGSDTPYFYVEGPIPYPDRTDWPSRTILTGEGGRTPSRFKHLIQVEDGRFRRLTPRELERLNGFPDDWTDTGMPDGRRAFMMGNALVVGLIERVGRELMREFRSRIAGSQGCRTTSLRLPSRRSPTRDPAPPGPARATRSRRRGLSRRSPRAWPASRRSGPPPEPSR